MKYTIFLFAFYLGLGKSIAQSKKCMVNETFAKPLNPKKWAVELEQKGKALVSVESGKLVLDTKGGVTVWLKQKLKGNYKISYKRKVIMEGGENDRLSDLNQFWLAEDLHNANLFTRKGKFEEYDSLRLYYVGMGGNYNSTTRFRKYQGNGERTLLAEKNEPATLLVANKAYQIEIIVQDHTTSFWVDGQCLFIQTDTNLPKEGYFGFRSTYARQAIWDFCVERLRE
jgi:hypothetical protein